MRSSDHAKLVRLATVLLVAIKQAKPAPTKTKRPKKRRRAKVVETENQSKKRKARARRAQRELLSQLDPGKGAQFGPVSGGKRQSVVQRGGALPSPAKRRSVVPSGPAQPSPKRANPYRHRTFAERLLEDL